MLDPRDSPPLAEDTAEPLVEEVDALPVLARDAAPASDSATGTALDRAASPAAQVVAVAASGFVAGAAVVGLMHRRRRRRAVAARGPSRRAPRGGPVGELVQIVGTRSLLVDVHLLGSRD